MADLIDIGLVDAPSAVVMPRMDILQYFAYEHLPQHLQEVSKPFHEMAHRMATTLPPCAELSAGLRKLLEAKDCAVRAKLYKPT